MHPLKWFISGILADGRSSNCMVRSGREIFELTLAGLSLLAGQRIVVVPDCNGDFDEAKQDSRIGVRNDMMQQSKVTVIS